MEFPYIRTQKNRLSGSRMLNCFSFLWGLAFALSTVMLFTSPKTLITEPPVGTHTQKNHSFYFYIWNPNLIDASGREVQLFKHVDFVCMSVQTALVAMAPQCMISVKVVLIESIKR